MRDVKGQLEVILQNAVETKAGGCCCDGLVFQLRELLAALPEAKVLASAGAEVYLRGSRAYAECGSGMIRLDTAEGLRDGEPLDVIITRRGESDEAASAG